MCDDSDSKLAMLDIMTALLRMLLLTSAAALAAASASRGAASHPPAVSVLDVNRRPLADGFTVSCDDDQKFPVVVSVSPVSKWRITASIDQSGLSCVPPVYRSCFHARRSRLITTLIL